MRVAVINITGGEISGGYRKYLCNVIPRMAKHPDIEAILCASPESLHVRDWFNELPGVDFVSCNTYKFLSFGFGRKLKRALEMFRPDVLFIPIGRFIRFRNVPVINMVQNMEPFVYYSRKNPVLERIRIIIRRKVASDALSKSKRIIAISKYVRQFIVENLGILEEKIGLVYHGLFYNHSNDKFLRPSAVPDNWKGRFLFTAGSIRPARGIEDILYAMENLAQRNVDAVLVIAGNTDSNMLHYRRTLEKYISKSNLSDRIIWAGNLNEAEMNWCYKNCRLFVMTSRTEACAIIALEAMSRRCLCIAANNPCLPEIFGDGTIYYPPYDSGVLSEKIREMLTWGQERRRTALELAKKRVTAFASWDEIVDQIVKEFLIAVG